jgi:hypothetical protein
MYSSTVESARNALIRKKYKTSRSFILNMGSSECQFHVPMPGLKRFSIRFDRLPLGSLSVLCRVLSFSCDN